MDMSTTRRLPAKVVVQCPNNLLAPQQNRQCQHTEGAPLEDVTVRMVTQANNVTAASKLLLNLVMSILERNG